MEPADDALLGVLLLLKPKMDLIGGNHIIELEARRGFFTPRLGVLSEFGQALLQSRLKFEWRFSLLDSRLLLGFIGHRPLVGCIQVSSKLGRRDHFILLLHLRLLLLHLLAFREVDIESGGKFHQVRSCKCFLQC